MPFPGNRGRGGGGGTGGPDRFTASDEAHLDALPPLWAAGVHAVDDQVSWDGKVYRCLVARTATDTDNPATDTTGWAEVGTGSSTGGLTQVASDATLTGDGRSSHPLTVANPFTDDDESKLDGIEAGATADQSAAEIIDAIEGETGNARLDAQALRNYPDASTTDKGFVELATRAEAAARTDTERAVTPDALPLATAAQPGLIEIADQDEADGGTDAAKAMTPATTHRQLGAQVSAAEIAAGTERSIRRYSPADIVAMVLAHEAEGLTQDEVDARVRALVLAVALQGNADRWPRNKLPADLVDTAALTAAVADFVPSGTITSERATAITAAINALEAVTDGGAWAAGTAYAVRVIVRHAGATYLSIRAAGANTETTTEPGAGSDWATYWDRLGYEDGPPNAIVGVTREDRTLTFTREGGENPLELALPTVSPTRTERITFNPQSQTSGNPELVPATNPLSVVFGGGDRTEFISDVSGNDFMLAAGVYVVDFEVDATPNNNNAAFNFVVRRASDNTVISTTTSPRLSGTDSQHFSLIAVLVLLQDTRVNAQLVTINQSVALTSAYAEFTRISGGAEAAPSQLRVERIGFADVPAIAQDGSAEISVNVNAATVLWGRERTPIVSGLTSGSADFRVRAGLYLLELAGTFEASHDNAVAGFRVRRASDDDDVTSESSTIAPDANAAIPASIREMLVLTEATDVHVLLQAHNVGTPGLRLTNGSLTLTELAGGERGEKGDPGASTFSPTDLGTTTFDLDGTAAQIALMHSGSPIVCPADGYILAIVNVPSLGLVGSLSWMLAADLRDAAADSALVAGLYTNADDEIVFHAGTQDGGASTGNEIIIQHIGTTTDESGSRTAILPSILRFDVTGDARPTAGSIAGDRYSFDLAISQTAEVGTARIVGFAGGPVANPSSVAVLATIPSGSYHADSGHITIPAGVSLTADEQYTIRLEVYPTDVAVTTAPTIYHDYVITAQAQAALVHFGLVQYNAADATVAQRAARIVFADNDLSTAGSAAGDWTIRGIPSDGTEYIPYWAVPTSLAQPTAWTQSSFPVTNFVERPVQRIIGGVTYNVYMYAADSRADDSGNGSVITTTL